jgi:hypothetical protein
MHHAELHPDEYRPGAHSSRPNCDGVMVDGLPLPEPPGARTVNNLRALHEWPRGLRLIVEPHAPRVGKFAAGQRLCS